MIISFLSFLKNLRSNLRHIKAVIKRELPSQEHQNAWSDFDRILMYRANVTFISKVIFMMIWMAFGEANYQQSKDYMEEDGVQLNQELNKNVYPFLKWAMIVMTFGRLILVFASIKNLAICKVYIYYQIVYLLLEEFLPRDYGDVQ